MLVLLLEGDVRWVAYNFRLLTRPLFRILFYAFLGVVSASDRLPLTTPTLANICCWWLLSLLRCCGDCC